MKKSKGMHTLSGGVKMNAEVAYFINGNWASTHRARTSACLTTCAASAGGA